MKAIELLKKDMDFVLNVNSDTALAAKYDEAIEELELLGFEAKELKEANKELLECLIATQEKLEGIIK